MKIKTLFSVLGLLAVCAFIISLFYLLAGPSSSTPHAASAFVAADIASTDAPLKAPALAAASISAQAQPQRSTALANLVTALHINASPAVNIAAAASVCLVGFYLLTRRKPSVFALANINEGVHDRGAVTKKADAAIATRNLVVKIGSDANHIAVAGTGDIALGVCQDEPTAAEENVTVQLLGSCDRTVLMVASAAIAAGDMVVTAASGKIRTLPAGAGTYYIIGRALQAAAADGDPIEIDPCFPVQRVVA